MRACSLLVVAMLAGLCGLAGCSSAATRSGEGAGASGARSVAAQPRVAQGHVNIGDTAGMERWQAPMVIFPSGFIESTRRVRIRSRPAGARCSFPRSSIRTKRWSTRPSLAKFTARKERWKSTWPSLPGSSAPSNSRNIRAGSARGEARGICTGLPGAVATGGRIPQNLPLALLPGGQDQRSAGKKIGNPAPLPPLFLGRNLRLCFAGKAS